MPKYHRKQEYLGGVLPDPEENKGKNWLFGGKDRTILREDGNYTEDLPNDEKQATNYFDPYSCVSESAESDVSAILFETMMKKDSSIKLVLETLGCLDENGKVNFSGRFPAVGSGTIPGRGNSQYAVFEFIRKNGLVGEKHWPTRQDMTEEEYFAPIPQSVKDLGKKFLQYFTFEYEDVGNSNAEMKEALKRSPLCVVIGGVYLGVKAGAELYRPAFIPIQYNHQVVLYNQENDVSDFNQTIPVIHDIFDTYEPFRKRFAGDYSFKYVKAIYITKKKIKNMKIYRKNGQAAIGFLNSEDGGIYLWADGKIAGGSLFKTLGFTYDLAEVVEEWPAEIKGYITTTGLLSNLE